MSTLFHQTRLTRRLLALSLAASLMLPLVTYTCAVAGEVPPDCHDTPVSTPEDAEASSLLACCDLGLLSATPDGVTSPRVDVEKSFEALPDFVASVPLPNADRHFSTTHSPPVPGAAATHILNSIFLL